MNTNKYDLDRKKRGEQLFYFSNDSQDTMNEWTGGGSFIHKFAINIFKWHIVFWRKP